MRERSVFDVAHLKTLMQSIRSIRTSAADPGAPHPHRGRLPTPRGDLPLIRLSTDEEARLDSGEGIIVKPQQTRHGPADVAVFRVRADAPAVWSVIHDVASYPEVLPDIEQCHVYHRDNRVVCARLKRTINGVSVRYFMRLEHDAVRGITYVGLDYNFASDLDDLAGYWRVTPAGGSRATVLQVESALSLRLHGWHPAGPRHAARRRELVAHGLRFQGRIEALVRRSATVAAHA